MTIALFLLFRIFNKLNVTSSRCQSLEIELDETRNQLKCCQQIKFDQVLKIEQIENEYQTRENDFLEEIINYEQQIPVTQQDNQHFNSTFNRALTCFPLFLLLLLSRRPHFTLLSNDLENYKSNNFCSKSKAKS